MKTEQINIRLEPDLVAAVERVAREESLDRGTAIRRLLETSIRRWELERALGGYQREELSLGRAAEEAGLTQWELIEAAQEAGIAYPLRAEQARRRLSRLPENGAQTLPDIPPQPGGVLLVGINPAPVSVAAGHYYQGRLGQRLWRRLERVGLLQDPLPGAEDEAFARAGHGLTDLVKRATSSSAELTEDEFRAGAQALRDRVKEWRPGLILFAFKEPARRLLGAVAPGAGPELEGVPTFLLSGPYAPRAEAERIDGELRALLGKAVTSGGDVERTLRVTAIDLAAGRIRLPVEANRFFPSEPGEVEVILRGTRVRCRRAPGSSALIVPKDRLNALVRPNEFLNLSRGLGGIPQLN